MRAKISKQNTVRQNRNILSTGMSLAVIANDFFVQVKTGEQVKRRRVCSWL